MAAVVCHRRFCFQTALQLLNKRSIFWYDPPFKKLFRKEVVRQITGIPGGNMQNEPLEQAEVLVSGRNDARGLR